MYVRMYVRGNSSCTCGILEQSSGSFVWYRWWRERERERGGGGGGICTRIETEAVMKEQRSFIERCWNEETVFFDANNLLCLSGWERARYRDNHRNQKPGMEMETHTHACICLKRKKQIW